MNFEVRPFHPESDAGWYSNWWSCRAFPPAPMPKTAVVLEQDGRPIAAGGLVLTDSDYVLPDGFCTNPEAPKELRQLALQNLFSWAAQEAVKRGYSRGIVMTSASSIFQHGIILEEGTQGAFKVEPFPEHRVFEIKFKGNGSWEALPKQPQNLRRQ